MAIGTPVSRGSTSGSTANPIVVTTTGAIASGSKVIVIVTYRTNSAISISGVSDNGAGLTYTIDKNVAQTTQTCGIISADAPSGLANGTNVSVTFASAVTRSFAEVWEVTGLAAQPALDQTIEAQTTSTAATTFSSTNSGTTTQADELAVYVVSIRNTTEASITWTNGTQLGFLNSTDCHGSAYQILSSTQTVASAGSYPTAGRNDAAAATYKGAAAAATLPPRAMIQRAWMM